MLLGSVIAFARVAVLYVPCKTVICMAKKGRWRRGLRVKVHPEEKGEWDTCHPGPSLWLLRPATVYFIGYERICPCCSSPRVPAKRQFVWQKWPLETRFPSKSKPKRERRVRYMPSRDFIVIVETDFGLFLWVWTQSPMLQLPVCVAKR